MGSINKCAKDLAIFAGLVKSIGGKFARPLPAGWPDGGKLSWHWHLLLAAGCGLFSPQIICLQKLKRKRTSFAKPSSNNFRPAASASALILRSEEHTSELQSLR